VIVEPDPMRIAGIMSGIGIDLTVLFSFIARVIRMILIIEIGLAY